MPLKANYPIRTRTVIDGILQRNLYLSCLGSKLTSLLEKKATCFRSYTDFKIHVVP
jgi:hypothetical protein